MAESVKEAAIAYAELGFRVTPLNGKLPATEHGFKEWTDESDDIKENWWHPFWNVGMPTGDGIITIDVDKDDVKGFDGHENVLAWEREHGPLPDTASFITGRGGYQLIYRVDRAVHGKTNGKLHIDIRGEGYGAVLPPSIHPETGKRYEWENHPEDVPIAWADDNVYQFLEFINEKPLDSYEPFELPDEVFEGEGRNDKLFGKGASWQAQECPDDAIIYGLKYINEHNFYPPLDDSERDKTINSVLKLPKGKSEKFKESDLSTDGLVPAPFDVDNIPDMPPALIDKVILKGGVLMLGGASKAGKTFMLLQLAMGLATGNGWMGFDCEMSRVLYVNLEVHPAEILHRARNVFDACYTADVKPIISANLHFIHLRGKVTGMDELVSLITDDYGTNYDVIIIDPSYKVIDGDENAAKDVHVFTNQLDRLATECEASVIYCHHHSKGAKGDIKSSERVSGSGVFSRHADAVIDMIELDVPEDLRDSLGIGENPCFRMEFTTRSFQRPKHIDTQFAYPTHRKFEKDELGECKPDSFMNKIGRKGRDSQQETKRSEAKRVVDRVMDYLENNEKLKLRSVAELIGIDRKTLKGYLEESGNVRIVSEKNADYIYPA